jgi:hypothetical protein
MSIQEKKYKDVVQSILHQIVGLGHCGILSAEQFLLDLEIDIPDHSGVRGKGQLFPDVGDTQFVKAFAYGFKCFKGSWFEIMTEITVQMHTSMQPTLANAVSGCQTPFITQDARSFYL